MSTKQNLFSLIFHSTEYVYDGSKDASIIRTEEFLAGFICKFELYLFPFDNHVCHINISIINTASSIGYFNISVSFYLTLLIYSSLI